jgi:hypothetical protein
MTAKNEPYMFLDYIQLFSTYNVHIDMINLGNQFTSNVPISRMDQIWSRLHKVLANVMLSENHNLYTAFALWIDNFTLIISLNTSRKLDCSVSQHMYPLIVALAHLDPIFVPDYTLPP